MSFMPKADRLSPGAVELLHEKQIAHVATVMADGSPQVTPVWVDVDDDGSHVIINSRQETLKTRNGVRDPRIALSVVDFANPYRVVQIRGTIVERRAGAEGGTQHIHKMAKKYRGTDEYANLGDQVRVMMRIKPTHVVERNVS
jgi:PPOX class probable F420-dependent enzyme